MTESCDNRVFGISVRPRERGLLLRKKTQWLEVATAPFSAFQTIHKKQGCNSIKNTVAKRGDNRVFGISDHPQERGLLLRNPVFGVSDPPREIRL